MILLTNSKKSIVGLEGYGLKVVGQKPVPRPAADRRADHVDTDGKPHGAAGCRRREGRAHPDRRGALLRRDRRRADRRRRAEITRNGATYERVVVPGAFEIPGAIALAADRYDGFVALGCVIRGETTHYDYVCGESARGLMDLSVHKKLAIGYGIVTVNTMEQAWARAATRSRRQGRRRGPCLPRHGGAAAPLAELVSHRQPKPPSRRQAARLAAVQALYQWQEGQDQPAEIIEQFLNVRTGEAGEGGMRRDADKPLFKDVVEGTASHKDELEKTVSAALAENWTWGRIDRLVRAILLAGAYELVHRRDVPPKVAINEYVEIAHAFYDQGESTFVNSVLDRVARQERAAELAG